MTDPETTQKAGKAAVGCLTLIGLAIVAALVAALLWRIFAAVAFG